MEKYSIKVATDFGDKLGGRWVKLGPGSGEEFFDKLLEQKYLAAKSANEKLHIYLDGAKGYGSSFLDQSFGELSRKHGVEDVKDRLIFHTQFFNWEVQYIMEEIWGRK